MENLLQVLKEATLFILTTQLFRHLLPGKKYLPYENVILSMAVLSMLIVPILSLIHIFRFGTIACTMLSSR